MPLTDRSPLSCWVRACAYAFAWLLPLGVMVWFLPRYTVRFARLDAQGELPELVHFTLAFVRINQAAFCLPAVLAFAAAVALAEALFRTIRRVGGERWGRRVWKLTVAGVGLLAWLCILAPPMMSVYRMGSEVAFR